MLLETWFDLPAPLIVLTLAAGLGSTALLLHALTFWPRTRPGVLRCKGLVAPFFGAVSVLFALLTGFVANDAWERNRQATRGLLAERDGLVAMHELSIATVSDMAAIRAHIRTYLDVVIREEWPRLRDGESAPAAAQALLTLLRDMVEPAVSRDSGAVAQAALLNLTLKVRAARSDRLAMSAQYSDHPKWWTVLLLAVLTQAALGLVHLEARGAQAAALVVFTAASVVALGLVAVKERPFDGPLALQPTILVDALAAMRAAMPPEPAAPKS